MLRSPQTSLGAFDLESGVGSREGFGVSTPWVFACRMTDVYLLGYAGSPEYVQQLAHECNSVTILDHHAAARDCFAALNEARALPPSVEVVVDADRSGATLAWDYFTDKAGGI